jgi:hypothetical protein
MSAGFSIALGVIPAKAGISVSDVTPENRDSRFRGNDLEFR